LTFRTSTKVKLASLLSRGLLLLRRLARLGPETEVTRDGLRWHLDLSEGVDLAIYLLGRFEGETVRAFRRELSSGDVVIDIGANSGANTLELARSVAPGGHVFAFEPTRYALDRLGRNLALNPELAGIVTVEHAFLASGSSGKPVREFYSSWPLGADATTNVHQEHRGRLMSAEGAASWTLDRYVEERNVPSIRLVKLDVDGNEWSVLDGARKTLERQRPLLVMELAPYVLDEREGSLESILGLLSGLGYELRGVSSGEPVPMSAEQLRARIPEGAGINVLAKPRSGDDVRRT
jgi:FkbM family methyltransferase